jgi:WD40 repeat protein
MFDASLKRTWTAQNSGVQASNIDDIGAGIAFSADGVSLFGTDGDRILVRSATSGVLDSTLPCLSPAKSISVSPDGRYLVSAHADGSAVVWETGSQRAVQTLRGHDGLLWDADFDPTSERIVTAGRDGRVIEWSWREGKALRTLSHRRPVYRAMFDRSGRRVITVSDRRPHVWSLDTGAESPLPFAGHTEDLTSISLSREGTLLATSSNDGTFRIWDFEKGDELARFQRQDGPVQIAVFDPTAERLAVGGGTIGAGRGDVSVWDLRLDR